jgi:hypothetical protein
VIIGLIAIAPFAAYRVAVEPWLAYRSGLRDALMAERDLFAREQGAIRDAATMPAEVSGLEDALSRVEPWLLDGAAAVAVTGRLTRRVTEVGQSVGILVQEVRTRDDAFRGAGLGEASVTVRAIGDLEGIARLLFAMENGEQLIRVEALSLRTAGMNDGDLERGQIMAAELVVSGYWRLPADTDSISPARGQ